jgi:hypothetical protein
VRYWVALSLPTMFDVQSSDRMYLGLSYVQVVYLLSTSPRGCGWVRARTACVGSRCLIQRFLRHLVTGFLHGLVHELVSSIVELHLRIDLKESKSRKRTLLDSTDCNPRLF